MPSALTPTQILYRLLIAMMMPRNPTTVKCFDLPLVQSSMDLEVDINGTYVRYNLARTHCDIVHGVHLYI